jgi:hypothetical protein
MITAMSVYECVSEDVDLLMIVVLMKENFDELIIIELIIAFETNLDVMYQSKYICM